MMRTTFILCFLLVSIKSFSQSDFKRFFQQSRPIKTWIIFHPFKAKKSYKISLEANRISDSIAKTNLLDKDIAGGQVDAFRHAYWMMRLKQEVGGRAACSLGKAHERENYLTFKKNKKEDGVVPDKISSEMDLINNEIGLQLISKKSSLSKKAIINRIVNGIKKGRFKIIKKDGRGNFLDSSGKILNKKDLTGKWENAKCLVKSNYLD